MIRRAVYKRIIMPKPLGRAVDVRLNCCYTVHMNNIDIQTHEMYTAENIWRNKVYKKRS